MNLRYKPQKDKTAELEYLRSIEMRDAIISLISKIQKDLDTNGYIFTNNRVQWAINQLRRILNET